MTTKQRVDTIEARWLERNGFVLRADDDGEEYITRIGAREPTMSADQMLRTTSRKDHLVDKSTRLGKQHSDCHGEFRGRGLPIYRLAFPSKRGIDL